MGRRSKRTPPEKASTALGPLAPAERGEMLDRLRLARPELDAPVEVAFEVPGDVAQLGLVVPDDAPALHWPRWSDRW